MVVALTARSNVGNTIEVKRGNNNNENDKQKLAPEKTKRKHDMIAT
jgi:hypothetical protein